MGSLHHRRRLGACNRCLAPAIGLALLMGFGAVRCTVGFDVANEDNLFSCSTNDDCIEGFGCYVSEGNALGVCRSVGPDTPPNCRDLDGDGYLGGEGCVQPEGLFDCNDDPLASGSLVHPGREEECNGVDDDCDDGTDEDLEPRICEYQAGVCAGATTTCVDGQWLDCIEAELYGPDFQLVAQNDERCDGLDNNCSGGYPPGAAPEVIDDHCDCLPGISPPTACGFDIGICDRGIKFCTEEGEYTDCVVAEQGDECEDDTDCDTGGYCVEERLDYREDLFDDCLIGSAEEAGCFRNVCRYLLGSQSCSGHGDCASDERCLAGSCQQQVQVNETEECNGMDNNCNGRIDDGGVCTTCPYNMVYFASIPGSPSGLCVDIYEASRPDATATNDGSIELYAASQEGVLPWSGITDTAEADNACRGTAINDLIPYAVPIKRLCQESELAAACGGSYPYGEGYSAGMCNDTGTVAPTGDFSNCITEEGLYDLAGNVAELFSSPYAGVFGGSAAESGGSDVACSAAVPLPDVEISDAFIGFRCCTYPSN